jgi:hypothetical protein
MAVALLGTVAALLLCWLPRAPLASAAPDATDCYLATLDLSRFIRNGSDYTNPYYSPLRLGKKLADLDVVLDYDFPRLEAVQQRLHGIDRRRVLAALFRRICAGCTTSRERHLAILEFCNKASFNNHIQPMWPDGTLVCDPLILLELGEMRCGQVARLVVDLFDAGGYPSRLVQLGYHIASEVYYDGAWHYLDAHLFGGRWTVYNDDGTIPSYAQLSQRPFAIDALPAYQEPTFENAPLGTTIYPSWFYSSSQAYETPPLYYHKTTSLQEQRTSRDYGWEEYDEVPDAARVLRPFAKKYCPAAPPNLRRQENRAVWDAAVDGDHDLIGYRVYFGSKSRGWCYGPGWKPAMYDARFRLPPGDLGVVETRETSVPLPEHRPLYVTVMPYDQHGKAVGRTLYPMSAELVLPASAE